MCTETITWKECLGLRSLQISKCDVSETVICSSRATFVSEKKKVLYIIMWWRENSAHTLQQQPGLAESHHVMFFPNEILLQFKVQEQGFFTLLGLMGFSRTVCLFSGKDQSIVAVLLHGLLIWVYYLFFQHWNAWFHSAV
jgi:hypothetical protein